MKCRKVVRNVVAFLLVLIALWFWWISDRIQPGAGKWLSFILALVFAASGSWQFRIAERLDPSATER